MALSIHTNVGSQFAHRAMSNAQNSIRTSIERLSSGLRINNASDDAAGLSIASRMTSHIRSSAPLMRGMNDGVSLLQVAGGGLRSTLDSLQRARELSVQAGNSVMSASDREALDMEYQQMMAQVNHVADNTEIFGIFPLKGKPIPAPNPSPYFPGSTKHITEVFTTNGLQETIFSGIEPIAYIPSGATDITIEIDSFGQDDDIQIFTADGKHLVGTPLTDFTWTANAIANSSNIKSELLKIENGFKFDAEYESSNLLDGSIDFVKNLTDIFLSPLSSNFNGMTFTYTGDADYKDVIKNNGYINNSDTKELLQIDIVTEPL